MAYGSCRDCGCAMHECECGNRPPHETEELLLTPVMSSLRDELLDAEELEVL